MSGKMVTNMIFKFPPTFCRFQATLDDVINPRRSITAMLVFQQNGFSDLKLLHSSLSTHPGRYH